jgi:hypothetical protein
MHMPYGLNGYFLLLHTGSDPERMDRFYEVLPLLIEELKEMGYRFIRADEMAGFTPEVLPRAAPKKAVKKRRRR